MSELQPGMLALVIGCRRSAENIGKIVELIALLDPGSAHQGEMFGGPNTAWKVKGDGLIGMNLRGDSFPSDHTYVHPSHLLPIKPEADPLDQKQQQELHA